jgi:arylsulfatase A-like enzyme
MRKVVVVALRGVSLGLLGCYGNDWIDTPALDRLAAESVVFDQHFADRPDPAGAARSWRRGRYDLPARAATPEVSPSVDLLNLLSTAEVPAVLVHDDSRPGAEEFLQSWSDVRRVPATADEGTALERSLEAAVTSLEELGGRERWLLWLSLATALPPWDVPESFRTRYFLPQPAEEEEEEPAEDVAPLEPLADPTPGLIDPDDDALFLRLRYSAAGATAYLDAGLALLLDHLRESRQLEDITLIVTADHGFPLGEHGVVGTVRPWLHEELVHIPLIVRLPAKARAGRRVSALTQSLDLMPTLLDILGLPPSPVHGHSLLPLAHGTVDQVRPYAVMGHRVGDAIEWALRTPEWMYLLPLGSGPGDATRPPQLFVKPDDRWEVNDVRQHHLDLAEHVEQVLPAFAAAARQPGPLVYPELRDVEAEQDEAADD